MAAVVGLAVVIVPGSALHSPPSPRRSAAGRARVGDSTVDHTLIGTRLIPYYFHIFFFVGCAGMTGDLVSQ